MIGSISTLHLTTRSCSMTSTLDTGKVAANLGTDARTLRKFLRSSASPLEAVGQGARYAITEADLPELREKFEAWRSGKRSSTSTPRSAAPRRPKVKAVEKADPLENDDIMIRVTSTIGDRQRAHGVICNHTWSHPKVKGMTVKCTGGTVAGTKFCKYHQQITWCGGEEPVVMICGPSPELKNNPSGHPYCRYHAGDISEQEFNQLLLDNPDADILE
jgi:hypothetical protein